MKTKILLSLVIAASASIAHAEMRMMNQVSSNVISNEGAEDYFTKVEAMYNQGTVTQTSDVMGWNSGRCYLEGDRSTPQNGVLVGFNDLVGSDNGPAFPGKNVFKLDAVDYNNGVPADYFEVLTPEKESLLASYLKDGNLAAKTAEATVQDSALVGGQGAADGVNDPRWSFRKFQNFVIMKWSQTSKVQGYCYYFKKLK